MAGALAHAALPRQFRQLLDSALLRAAPHARASLVLLTPASKLPRPAGQRALCQGLSRKQAI